MQKTFSTFIRKAIIAASPRTTVLKRKLTPTITFGGINKAGFGGRGVYLKGLDYEAELSTLAHFLADRDVFIDIGANTGVYSILAADLLPKGTVISYEPFPLMSNYLLENVMRNNLPNVRIRTFGISNTNSSKKFFMNKGRPNSFSFSRNVDNALEIQLFTKTLDDAILMENLDRVDYIKIDAEGEEEKVIEGAQQVIKKFRPIIQTEALFGELAGIDGYLGFKAVDSVNNVYIPRDSKKVAVARQLGWTEVQ